MMCASSLHIRQKRDFTVYIACDMNKICLNVIRFLQDTKHTNCCFSYFIQSDFSSFLLTKTDD
jgi:hypothetical protein